MTNNRTSRDCDMFEWGMLLPEEDTLPVCPQFRPYANEDVYPVRGHCAPLHRPGWFVIPSIEEFGLYCTDAGFARCPWFRGGAPGDDGGPAKIAAASASASRASEPTGCARAL